MSERHEFKVGPTPNKCSQFVPFQSGMGGFTCFLPESAAVHQGVGETMQSKKRESLRVHTSNSGQRSVDIRELIRGEMKQPTSQVDEGKEPRLSESTVTKYISLKADEIMQRFRNDGSCERIKAALEGDPWPADVELANALERYAKETGLPLQVQLCPNCANVGYYADGPTDSPEQVQCEFCETTPNSLFTITQAILAASHPSTSDGFGNPEGDNKGSLPHQSGSSSSPERLSGMRPNKFADSAMWDKAPSTTPAAEAGQREFDHFSIIPFKAICGADRSGQTTTQTPERTKCPICWQYWSEWYASYRAYRTPEPQPDQGETK